MPFFFFFLEFLSLRYHSNVSAKYPMESLPIDENGELLVITLENENLDFLHASLE